MSLRRKQCVPLCAAPCCASHAGGVPTPSPEGPTSRTSERQCARYSVAGWGVARGLRKQEGTRRGKIAFRLRAGKDTAEGLVTVDGPEPPAGCVDPLSLATAPRVAGKLALTLGTVTVGEPSVGGWLRPYQDPELGCLVDTWFEGTIDRDTIRGMYFTNPADTAKALRLGNWWVSRRR